MKKDASRPVTQCQVCGEKKLIHVLSLGHHPIPQEYLSEKTLRAPETSWPLTLVQCAKCGLVQVDYIVEPAKVFPKHYPYRTGLTNMLIRNFRSLAETLSEKYPWQKGDLIVDIGSNDGTLLAGFKEKGMKVLGVEPTDAAKVANKNKITTIQAFFDKKLASQMVKKYGKAKIVTATNVFAHIPDAPGLAKNVASLLAKDGVFVSESQYLMDIVDHLEFDTVYHEHLRFYSLKPLVKLLEKGGMSIVHAERISAAGGSIRVYAMKGKHKPSEELKQLLDAEEKAGLYNGALKKFAERVQGATKDLLALLLDLKKQGKSIAGLTSSCRSSTLLHYAHIDASILDYAGEKSGSPKIGLYTPGTHVPVVDEARILKEQPDYLLMLSWHIGKELAAKMRELGYKGKFIIPLPKPEVIS